MGSTVLVAYASKHGGTRQIAERIGQTLRQAGVRVDVAPVDSVHGLDDYGAVVLGSAVYYGRWRKPAASFLKDREKDLAGRPIWLFSSGPTGKGDAAQLVGGWRLPEALMPVAERLQTRDTAVFHGALDKAKLGLLERIIAERVNAAFGDFHDWKAVDAWADGIARSLTPLAAQTH